MTDKHVLEGKTITGVEWTKDKKAIRFLQKGGEPIRANTDADCCSNTWIDSVSLPALGFPAFVTAVKELDLDHKMKNDGETKYYGLKIETDHGELIIEYRNESNGYYGGSLSFVDEEHYSFYGGVYDQNVADDTVWEPAKE